MVRKNEFFAASEEVYGIPLSTSLATIKYTFPQERDWTCSIACFRTLLSTYSNTLFSEQYFVDKLNRKPGPMCSDDFKSEALLNDLGIADKVVFGCDRPITEKLCEKLTELLKTHNVMVACTLNGGHWLAILGYVALGNIEHDKIIFYDPYYDDVRTFRADEFFAMWESSYNGCPHDYIAIAKGDTKC